MSRFHPSRQAQSRRRLFVTVVLTGVTFIAEAVGGLLTNSLALLSDAGHMFTHLLALLVSLLAVVFAGRPATERRTYGLNRLEILAALFNGATLLLVSAWIFYEAYKRLLEPEPIATEAMMLIAIIGLVVNLLCAYVLHAGKQEDLNVRAAFVHLLTDTLSSVGVVLGALVISMTGWTIIDPLLSVVVCAAILYWAFKLIGESVDILLEATPRNMDLRKVIEGLRGIAGVKGVHHLHVWTITSGMLALSAHLDVGDLRVSETEELAEQAERFLKDRFNINHTTFQFECRRGRVVDDALSGVFQDPLGREDKVRE